MTSSLTTATIRSTGREARPGVAGPGVVVAAGGAAVGAAGPAGTAVDELVGAAGC